MNNIHFWRIISKNISSIAMGGLLLGAVTFAALMFTSKNFKVSTDFLIIQNQSGNQDMYTLSKSAEYMGRVLNEAIYSERFIEEVAATKKIEANFLPENKKDRLEKWSEMVQVRRNAELGILSVMILDNDRLQALAVSQAVTDVLTQKNNLFRSENQNMEVRVLTGPLWEKNPSAPMIAAAAVAGLLLGAMLRLGYLVFSEQFRIGIADEKLFSIPLSQQERMERAGVMVSGHTYPEREAAGGQY